MNWEHTDGYSEGLQLSDFLVAEFLEKFFTGNSFVHEM